MTSRTVIGKAKDGFVYIIKNDFFCYMDKKIKTFLLLFSRPSSLKNNRVMPPEGRISEARNGDTTLLSASDGTFSE